MNLKSWRSGWLTGAAIADIVRPTRCASDGFQPLEGDTSAPAQSGLFIRRWVMPTKRAGRRKRRSWSTAEVRELRAHSRSKSPVKKIAKAMKRTAGALRQKALSLGLPLGHRRWVDWIEAGRGLWGWWSETLKSPVSPAPQTHTLAFGFNGKAKRIGFTGDQFARFAGCPFKFWGRRAWRWPALVPWWSSLAVARTTNFCSLAVNSLSCSFASSSCRRSMQTWTVWAWLSAML